MDPERAARLVKAYDIRGLAPQELDEEAAHRIGAAFAELTGAREIALAADLRDTSPALAAAFTRGVLEQGVGVVDAGRGPVDYLSFVSARLQVPGAMVTGGHNPAGYNGIKLCRAGAVPVGEGTGLAEIRAALAGPAPLRAKVQGCRREIALLPEYAAHLRSLVGPTQVPEGSRPLRIVVAAGGGPAGAAVPLVLDRPGLTLVELPAEAAGGSLRRAADPTRPVDLAALRARVRAERADLGLAFCGDGGRCLAVDERGEPVPASSILALLGTRLLAAEPGAVLVHDLTVSRGALEAIEEAGGKPVRSRVGHTFVRALMAEHQAVLGGEHSGRYYFRDFRSADSGLLAALHLLAELAGSSEPLSRLTAGYRRTSTSGEVTVKTADPAGAIAAVERSLGDCGALLDRLDGLTASFPDGSWFNLRASHTEPVLRLNAEAGDVATLGALRDHVLAAVAAA